MATIRSDRRQPSDQIERIGKSGGRCQIVHSTSSSVPVSPWDTTNITLLGDAIHAMSPSGGSGANIALRDAGLLYQKISFASAGAQPLLEALQDYEAAMLDYGFKAVRQSERGPHQGPNPFALPTMLIDKVKGLVRRSSSRTDALDPHSQQ
jgi:2-polyprenyl-6-methoxyphenol hydroxylase-like FAD-dependent oxidoreductase